MNYSPVLRHSARVAEIAVFVALAAACAIIIVAVLAGCSVSVPLQPRATAAVLRADVPAAARTWCELFDIRPGSGAFNECVERWRRTQP